MRTQRDPNSRQSDPADHEWDRLKRLVESSATSRRIGDDSITWEKATDPLDPPLLRIGRVAAMFHDEGYRILFRRQVSKPKAPNSVQMFPDPSPIAEKWWWLEPDVEDDFLWVVSETIGDYGDPSQKRAIGKLPSKELAGRIVGELTRCYNEYEKAVRLRGQT
jgi:hypothetical protein